MRDAYVLAGNTAVLKCEIPAFVKEYVAVTSWFQDSAFNIYPTAESGKCDLSAGLLDLHAAAKYQPRGSTRFASVFRVRVFKGGKRIA